MSKHKYIRSGFWGINLNDTGTLDLTKTISEVLNDSGYPVSNNCCSDKYSLMELDFVDDTAAAASGRVAIGSLYRTGNIIKIRLV